ncbi:MAG: hypothetical protein IT369_22255 [Candidatus Latescibacteria bacterium]|nr:hypothetical protein [Candidatus Latescibacterota bacterium]
MFTSANTPWPRLQRRGLQGLLLFALLFSPLSAHAALKSWSAAVDGAWDDPAKWSPAGVPAATDSVRIAAAGTYTVTLQGSVAVAQLSVGGNGGNPTLWVQGSTARGNAALRVNGGAANAGVIRLESTGGATTANLTLPTGTLVNQGTIEINAGSGGQRQLSADLDNQGTFRVNAAALLNKVGGVYTNQGEFRVQTGQSLTISGGSQVFNQNGGTLVVDGAMPLTSVTFNFNGGSIPDEAPLLLTSTLNIGATGAASFKLRGRSTLDGNIAAGQTVWVNGTTKTDAVLTWNSGLTNAGTLRLASSEAVAASNLVLPSGTLVNTGLIEVKRGSGGGRSLIANLDNRGTFTMDATTRLTQTSNGVFNNRGAITLTPADTLEVAVGTFTNRAGGTFTGGGLLLLDRSTLAGAGTIGANVEAWESTISPGSPVGLLRVEGSYYQDAFSEVNIDLGGATPGTGYDRLEVGGEAYFDGGNLNVSLINGYQPGACDQFGVVGYGSWQRLFENIDEPGLPGGLQMRSVYDTDGVKLRVSDGDTRINIVPTELNLAEGGGSQSYRVCLGRRPESQVRVSVSPDAQVQVAPVELIFAQAAWSAAQSVAVTAVDDAVGEGLHTGIVSHSSSSSDGDFNRTEISRVVAHIEDNEAAPALSVSDVSVTEGNSGTKQAQFTVNLSAASSQTVTVAWATANGTATAGSDYAAANSTLSFSPGQTSRTFAVTINGDLVTEADETFTVNLSNPANATLADAQGLGTIVNDDTQASLSINDVSVAEGNSGTRTLTFAVGLSAASSQTVTVAWATANGTATAGSDYVAATGTLSFSPGQTSRNVVVTVNGDVITEADETLTVNLSNPANATLGDAQGQGTITNDDATPSLSVGDAATTEGNSGTKALNLTVLLSNPSSQAITVSYATANGTASDASDYAAASGTLNFAAGETSKTVAVTVNGDLLNEASETFTLNLSNPTNASIGDGQGQGTLTNDDAAPALSVGDAAGPEGNSGTSTLSFTVTLSAASEQTVTVSYATANGTATAGSDYVAASGALSFAPGETSKTVAVTINGDLTSEPNETFTLNLSNPANASIGDGQGQGTLTNDDAQASLSVNDVAVAEGNSGTRSLTFTLTLSAASNQTVTVAWATANGTATAGSDYNANNGTLSFSAGQTSRTVAVTVRGDNTVEPNETFFLNLSNANNATIADGQGIGTITNDDGGSSLTINDVAVSEGNSGTRSLSFTVSLSPASAQAVTVVWATANGTATAGSDYVAANGTLTFAAGQTSRTIAVTVNGDLLNEGDETLVVNLSNAGNAILADNQGQGTITDDDTNPTISISDASVSEGNSGTKSMTFTVRLAAASGRALTVPFATANGTATAGSDYVSASSNLVFTPGVTSRSVTITVNGDLVTEADETFTVNLSSPTNVTIADGQGVGTITNDDVVPSLVINDVAVAEGNSGTKNLIFTVTQSVASGQTVTVSYATANGTATAGSDYVAASGTLNFAPGETSKTIAVTINGDVLSEVDETFALILSNPANATLADAQGQGTLTNDDAQPSLAIDDVAVAEGNSGTKALTFTVALSNPSTQNIAVSYATANGTATAGSDYVAASGTLSFAPGETSKAIAVTVNGDGLNEVNETFTLTLSAPVNATISDALGTGTLTNDDALPSLALGDGAVSEGDTGTRLLSFAVRLSAPSGREISVAYATANGTAAEGSDYVAASGTLNFAVGDTVLPVNVTIKGDLLNEADEVFALNLSNPVNAAVTDGQAAGTITNEDPVPTLAVADASVAEGNSGADSLVFTVTLSAASGRVVNVAYTTTSGTASADTDYVAVSGILTLAEGETSKTVAVVVKGDLVTEPSETLGLTLSAPINATLADAQGTGTLTNDDPVPSLAVADMVVDEGDSGTSTLSFAVTLSNPSSQVISVSYATANGTATAGSDYTATTGTLSFAAGETSKIVEVVAGGDVFNEASETFTLNLSAPANATISDAQGTGTLTNDDPVPSLAVDDATVTEGNTGSTTLSFTVTLSAASGQTVSVAYTTANGTAVAGSDYTAASGTLSFAPGETSRAVAVSVNGELVNEPDETLTLILNAPTSATLDNGQATGTISNDDPVPGIAVNNAAAAEGNSESSTLSFAVTLSNPGSQTITVQYATANGSATAGSDYTAASGTLSFAPGETSKTVAVSVTGDALNEANEIFTLNLSAPTNATIGDAQGVGTITNDDPVPSLAVNDVTIAEGNSGTSAMTFTVTLSAASGQTVSVA